MIFTYVMRRKEIKVLINKSKADFTPLYTAEEFVHIDDDEDTCK
jgi:hypothetical protein